MQMLKLICLGALQKVTPLVNDKIKVASMVGCIFSIRAIGFRFRVKIGVAVLGIG